MKILKFMKDGGPESRVWGFFFIEIKSLFSVVLLKFSDGSREAYHSHAFNSISWVFSGCLCEKQIPRKYSFFLPSLKPVITTRKNMHRVTSYGNTYVLSFRGPWNNYWEEFLPASREIVTLTHGRKELDRSALPDSWEIL